MLAAWLCVTCIYYMQSIYHMTHYYWLISFKTANGNYLFRQFTLFSSRNLSLITRSLCKRSYRCLCICKAASTSRIFIDDGALRPEVWTIFILVTRWRYASNFTLQDTHTCPFYSPLDFVQDYPGELVPEPMWILLKQETVNGSGISWAICKSAPRPRQITTPAPHHSVFYRPDTLPATQPTASKLQDNITKLSDQSFNL